MDHNLGANPEDLHSMFTNTFAKASSGTYGGGPATPDSRAYTPQSNSGAGYVDEFGMSMGATVPGQYPMSSQQWPQQQAYQGSDLDFPSSNGYHRGGGGGGGAVSDGYGTDPTFAYEAQSPHQTASSSLHHHQHQQQPQQTSHHQQQQQQQHMMPSYPSMHAQPDHQQQYNNSWATQQSYLPQQQQQQQQPTHQPLSGPSFPQQPVSSSNGPKIKQENYALEENLMVAGLLPVQPQASVASTSSSIASAPNPSESDFYSSVKPSPGMSLGSPSGTQTPLSSVSGDSLPGNDFGGGPMKRNGSVRGSSRGRGRGAGRGGGGRGGRQKKPDPIDPTEKDKKDKERRFSNNTRERMRIKDINLALNELGHICKNITPEKFGIAMASADDDSKPNTKLGVLNMAVEVITMLERKVKERNMSPATLCLQNQSPGNPAAPQGAMGANSLPQQQHPK